MSEPTDSPSDRLAGARAIYGDMVEPTEQLAVRLFEAGRDWLMAETLEQAADAKRRRDELMAQLRKQNGELTPDERISWLERQLASANERVRRLEHVDSVLRRDGGKVEDELNRLREENANLDEGLRRAAQDRDRFMAERDEARAEVARLLDDPDCPEGHEFAPIEVAVGDVTCCRQCGAWFRMYEKGYDRLPPLPRIVAQLDEARTQRDEARDALRRHLAGQLLPADAYPWLDEEQP